MKSYLFITEAIPTLMAVSYPILDLLSYPETPYYILQSALSLPYLYLLLGQNAHVSMTTAVSLHKSLARRFAAMYKKRMTDSLQIRCVRGINCVGEEEDILLTFDTWYIKVNRPTPVLAPPTVSWCLPLDMGSWNFTILQVRNFNWKSSLKSDCRLDTPHQH